MTSNQNKMCDDCGTNQVSDATMGRQGSDIDPDGNVIYLCDACDDAS